MSYLRKVDLQMLRKIGLPTLCINYLAFVNNRFVVQAESAIVKMSGLHELPLYFSALGLSWNCYRGFYDLSLLPEILFELNLHIGGSITDDATAWWIVLRGCLIQVELCVPGLLHLEFLFVFHLVRLPNGPDICTDIVGDFTICVSMVGELLLHRSR